MSDSKGAGKCQFYLEVKDLKDGEAKVFTCDCRRHLGDNISVVVVDKVIREVRNVK